MNSCEACEGSGITPGTASSACEACGGAGELGSMAFSPGSAEPMGFTSEEAELVRRLEANQREATPVFHRVYQPFVPSPPRGIFRRGDAHTSLWLTRVVLLDPRVQIDSQGGA